MTKTPTKRFTPRIDQKENTHFLEAQPARDEQALILPLSVIHVPGNIRSEPSAIDELAASIAVHGLLQPLIISKINGRLELVAGQRRYAALKQLSIETAPVRILGADADQVAVLRLIENIQREQLSGIDEVRAVAKLMPIFDNNQSAVARAIGRGQPYVNQCVRAAKLIEAHPTYSAPNTSKSLLFELANSKEPAALLEKLEAGEVKTTRQAREKSGAVPGGRYGAQGAIQFNERSDGQAFSLRLNFHRTSTPTESRAKMIQLLEDLLRRLKIG